MSPSEQGAGRKAGTTSNQHGPYALGDTRATMADTAGLQGRKAELILKIGLSSD